MFNNGQNPVQFNPFQMGQQGGQPGNDPQQMIAQKLSSLFPGGFQNWLSARMGGQGGWNTQVNPAMPQPGAPDGAPGGAPNYISSILAKIRGLPGANTPMMGG